MPYLDRCIVPALPVFLACALAAARAGAATGTFLDRQLPTDLRVATFNVNNDSIFPDTDAARAARFARVAAAVNADVWAFEEFYNHSASQAVSLMNSLQPLGAGKTWYAYKGGLDQVIVSKYPLSLTAQSTIPFGDKEQAMALVNLPDAIYGAKDLYLMDEHYKAFSGFDDRRQAQSDSLVSWMRDARTAGGNITLSSGTPMVVLGDLNLVDGTQPRDTLIDGNIINSGTFGADSPPDWDGTSNTDADPPHNGVGPQDYTWRDDTSSFPPGRLDYVIYTDSVMGAGNKFVLNTHTMTAGDRADTGLQSGDSLLSESNGHYDHLPVIVDFRMSGAKSLTWNPGATVWNTVNTNWRTQSSVTTSFADGDVALFGNAGVGTVTIAMNADPAPGAVIISNSSGTYNFVGGAIRGSAPVTKMNAGAVTFMSANTYTGGTTVSGGTLTLADPDALGGGSLSISQSARVVLADGLPSAARIVGSLSIRDSAVLDLRNNAMIIDYTGSSPLNQLVPQIGNGIISSLADAAHRIGYADNATLGLATFSGTLVDPTTILLKFTLAGDSNLDGQVDVTDLGALASNWQSSGDWTGGDFNYDGHVDVADLGLLASNWQAGEPFPSGASLQQALAEVGLSAKSVPEPAMGLLALSLLLVGRRHGRRRSICSATAGCSFSPRWMRRQEGTFVPATL